LWRSPPCQWRLGHHLPEAITNLTDINGKEIRYPIKSEAVVLSTMLK
jgi:hypothetical protein